MRAIQEADVVIEQLTDVAPRAAAGGLRAGAEHVLVPLVACGFLWPFAGETRPGNKPTWFNGVGAYPAELSDGYLNRLLAKGVSPDQAVEEYRNLDVNSVRNLDRLHELVMDRQKHRDEVTRFRIADLIESFFRTERVFVTPHHPAPRIMHALVEQLFERIGVPKQRVGVFRRLARETLLPWTEAPIHPSVARHFALAYVADDTRYRCSADGYLTFKQWVVRYMRGDWNADLEEGIALSVSDPKRALDKLEMGLARSPESPDGHFARGEALRALGQFDDAEASLRHAIALCPEEARFHYGLSMALNSLGRWEEALSEARLAINAEPSNAHFHAAAAHAAWRGHLLSEAEAFARDAVALEPAKGGLRGLLANLLYEQARFAEAEVEADRAASMDTKDVHILVTHSRILEALGRGEEAEQAVLKAVALRPDYAPLHSHAGHLRARLGRVEDAIASFEEAIRLEPGNPSHHSGISHSLNRVGRPQDAIAAVRRAMELRPNYAADYAHLGNLLRARE